MQVLQCRWTERFPTQLRVSTRTLRHQAVEQAQQYIAEGYRFVVDLDWKNSLTGLIMTN